MCSVAVHTRQLTKRAGVHAPKLSPEFLSQVKRCFGPRERRPLATKDQKFASLTNDFIHFLRPHGRRSAEYASRGARRAPGSHFPRKAMAHAEQPWACAPAINIASSRRPSKPVERLRTHHSTERLAACKHAGSTPHTSNYERTAARADPAHDTPGSLTCDKPEGGHVRRGGAAGAAGAPACHQSARSSTARPSGPSRTSARLRSSPIVMVLMLALHHQRQTCATSGAISDRTGQRSGWKRF